MLYSLLDWDEDCRYKILGYRISVDGEQVYIFDLLEPEVFYDRRKQATKEADASLNEPNTDDVTENSPSSGSSYSFGASIEENQIALMVNLDEYQSADTPLTKQEAVYAGSSP